jgi:hypothetical protein
MNVGVIDASVTSASGASEGNALRTICGPGVVALDAKTVSPAGVSTRRSTSV